MGLWCLKTDLGIKGSGCRFVYYSCSLAEFSTIVIFSCCAFFAYRSLLCLVSEDVLYCCVGVLTIVLPQDQIEGKGVRKYSNGDVYIGV